uniref:Large T antigen n=1 Tax=Budgerigar fledgling disease virus TaxID=1891747 RepID=B9A7F7_BFPYV|nr:large T antigen [Gammapolyomavirus avis]AKU38322.1 large T antigen [Gammapolyomavirus avis]AKU38331.1 large T antigen [Gammapolyomavirus avis]AKU38349.1 large T antigen [Gammapolyomavirus avis]QBR39168.1 large T antigen [Gammapolyomavirus avis]
MASLRRLTELLGLPVTATAADIKTAYRRTALKYHPDKGGDEEKMKELNTLMEEFRETEGLRADETLEDSDPEPEESGYATFENGTEPQTTQDDNSQDSQYSTPPKRGTTDYELPPEVEAYLLTPRSVQSCPDCHLLITSITKMPQLKAHLYEHFGIKGHMLAHWTGIALLVLQLEKPTRISTVHNFCKKYCTISICSVRGIKKNCVHALIKTLLDVPGLDPEECSIDMNVVDEKQFMHAMLYDYAVQIDCTDALLLLAIYKRLAQPTDKCPECQKDKDTVKRKRSTHIDDHPRHQHNASLFLHIKDQKRLCQCAVDAVLAEKRFRSATMTRDERLKERFRTVLRNIQELLDGETEAIDDFVTAILLFNMLFPDVDVIVDILQTMVKNPPKRRYYIFKGPVNTGKTTVAAAILALCTGASLNVNGTPDRLQFELGCAIDQFMVLFEDVKGTPEPDTNLPSGFGMVNLDNLRDHLEGSVPVNLERKHQNKVSQIFPPGIITMNNYVLPHTIQARARTLVNFKHIKVYAKALRNNISVLEQRLITKPETLLAYLLIRPESEKEISADLRAEFLTVIENLKFEVDERFFQYNNRLHEGLCVHE